MKQGERISFPVGCGAAVIKEHSNNAATEKLPTLSVCLPEMHESVPTGSGERDRVYAPASLTIYGAAVRELYEGLRSYYEAKEDGK